MNEKHPASNPKIKAILENLSTQDFKNFGLHQIAYIRAIQDGNDTTYAIHSADGKKISAEDTLNKAIIATRQNDLEPVTIH